MAVSVKEVDMKGIRSELAQNWNVCCPYPIGVNVWLAVAVIVSFGAKLTGALLPDQVVPESLTLTFNFVLVWVLVPLFKIWASNLYGLFWACFIG